jgi:hypothetical protein
MIQIGNTPIMLQDPSGQIDQHIEKHHTLELMRAFERPAAVQVPRGTNLLFPNYPSLPAPRLNQIVLPTGATRWGYGLFLVTTTQKDAILTEAALPAKKGRLKVTFCTGDSWKPVPATGTSAFKSQFSLTMSPLPPRPMTPTGLPVIAGVQDLWVLPMVDQRYWWQWLNVDRIESESFADVQAIIDYLDGKLNDTANLLYSCKNPKHDKIPDIATGNNYENVAVVLETLAWHIGCQLVPEINENSVRGTAQETGFALLSVDDSPVIHDNNLKGKIGLAPCTRPTTGAVTSANSGWETVGFPAVAMGGPVTIVQGSAFLPESILLPAAGTYAKRKASEVGLTTVRTVAGTSGVFRVKFKDADPVPDALRDQVVKDFYNRFSKIHDYTFSGIQKWQPTAFDDCVILSQARFTGSNEVRFQTRVRSWMQNLMPETMVAASKATTTTGGGGSTAGSCGNCLTCVDPDEDNSHTECANLTAPSINSWFTYKDVSDCCDTIHDNNIEMIHVDGGCVWESKEYTCKEKFIEEPFLDPSKVEVVENIFFKWILTVGATWTELEQRFYRKT